MGIGNSLNGMRRTTGARSSFTLGPSLASSMDARTSKKQTSWSCEQQGRGLSRVAETHFSHGDGGCVTKSPILQSDCSPTEMSAQSACSHAEWSTIRPFVVFICTLVGFPTLCPPLSGVVLHWWLRTINLGLVSCVPCLNGIAFCDIRCYLVAIVKK